MLHEFAPQVVVEAIAFRHCGLHLTGQPMQELPLSLHDSSGANSKTRPYFLQRIIMALECIASHHPGLVFDDDYHCSTWLV
jgi:hypothetical protein